MSRSFPLCRWAGWSFLVGLFLTSSTPAQTVIDWIDPLGGPYTSTSNWSGGNVPNSTAESAQFNVNATYDVTFSANSLTTISDLLVINGDVTFTNAGSINDATLNMFDDATISGGDLTLNRQGGTADVNLTIGDDLTVNGGNTLAVETGALVDVNGVVNIGNNGFGTVVVDGAGSSIDFAGAVDLGLNGNIGTLTLQNGSTGNVVGGLLELVGGSAFVGTTGRLNVLSGSTLEASNITVGNSFSTTEFQEATLIVSGPGSVLTQTGAATLTIGDAGNANIVADVVIQGAGAMTTGTGAVLIQNSGFLFVNNGAFTANGNVTVDGATLRKTQGGNFNLAAGLSLTAMNNAQLQIESDQNISEGTTWTLQSGADYVTDTVADDLIIGDGSNGTLVVEGSGTTVDLSAGGNGSIGRSGGTGNVTIRDNASAIFNQLLIGNSVTAGTTGVLNIQNGAQVNANLLNVAGSAGSTTSGIINISGGPGVSRLTIDGSGTLTVGDNAASDGPGTINVTNFRGELISGTGLTTIRRSGLIEVSDGLFQANGDIRIDGGELREINFGEFDLEPGLTLTAVFGGQVNFDSLYSIDEDTTFLIESGSNFSVTNNLDVGSSVGESGTLVVDGIGSSMSVTNVTNVGRLGGNGNLTLRSGANATFAEVSIVDRPNGNPATGVVAVESGADATSTNLLIGAEGGVGTSASLTVAGLGSTWTTTVLTLGDSTTGAAELEVLNGASFTTLSFASFLSTGVMTIDGGTVSLAAHTVAGGRIDLVSGSLTSGNDWTIEPGGVLGHLVDLTPGKDLATSGASDDLILEPGGTVTLNGGSLDVDNIQNNGGSFQFNSGTLNIRNSTGLTIGAAGPFGSLLSLGGEQTLDVTNTLTVDVSATLVVGTGADVQFGGLSNNGSVVLDGAAAILSGTFVSNSGLLRGEGVIVANVTNNVAGEIRAQPGKTLSIHGTNNPNAGRINLQGGALQFSQALTNSITGNIVGRGTLEVGVAGLTNQGDLALSNGQTDIFGDLNNETTGRVIVSGNADVTFWDDVTHTGALFNVSSGSSVTFFGDAGFSVSGGGDVFFENDITPGSSPGVETFGGDVFFGALSTLEIEIGGTTPGAEFDRLEIAGVAQLGGTLTVELIDLGGGFYQPRLGDSFGVLVAGVGVGGLWHTLNLPQLAPGLEWMLNQGSVTVSLSVVAVLPGDYNFDGVVDAADYAVWRDTLGLTGAGLPADGDQSGTIDTADYGIWRSNFGNTAAAVSASQAAVPEPSALIGFVFAGIVLGCMSRDLTKIATGC